MGGAVFCYSDYNHYNRIEVMMPMRVTFCGHSEVSQPEALRNWLHSVVRELIADGADTFYLGGYEVFDRMAAAVIRQKSRRILP